MKKLIDFDNPDTFPKELQIWKILKVPGTLRNLFT